MPKPIIKIDRENTTRFLEKLRALQNTDPVTLIPIVLAAGIESMSGSVEYNLARMLGTSVNQIGAWCVQSPDFTEAVNIIATARTADLLSKLEDGELGAPSVDRLIYANTGECFEPPKVQKTLTAGLSLSMVNLENFKNIVETETETNETQDGAGK
jgi:hypothetical protein